jgi:hypothetical protein
MYGGTVHGTSSSYGLRMALQHSVARRPQKKTMTRHRHSGFRTELSPKKVILARPDTKRSHTHKSHFVEPRHRHWLLAELSPKKGTQEYRLVEQDPPQNGVTSHGCKSQVTRTESSTNGVANHKNGVVKQRATIQSNAH